MLGHGVAPPENSGHALLTLGPLPVFATPMIEIEDRGGMVSAARVLICFSADLARNLFDKSAA